MFDEKNQNLANRKAVIDYIIEHYLFRDSEIVASFQIQFVSFIETNCPRPLSKTTWEIIYFLCSEMFTERDISASDIYSSLDVSKTAVIRYLNRLESWSVIAKVNDPTDKRRNLVSFTGDFEKRILSAIDHCFDRYGDQIQRKESRTLIENDQILSDRLARFKDFAKISSDWFWETDENHRFTWFSESHWVYLKLNEYKKFGARRWDFHAPTTVHECLQMEHHRQDLAARRPFRDFVYRVTLENGNEAWCAINGNPVFDDQNRFQGYFGSGRDVSNRREIVESLRRSEDRLRSVVNLAADCNWIIDHEFRYTWYSEGYSTLSRGPKKEILGHLLWEKFAPNCKGATARFDSLRKDLEAHKPFRDVLFRVINGPAWNVSWCTITGVPLFDPIGHFEGYQGICRDVTEQNRRQKLSAKRNKALEGLVRGQPVHQLIPQVLDVIERLRPGTPVNLFLRSSQIFQYFDGINPDKDATKSGELTAIGDRLLLSISSRPQADGSEPGRQSPVAPFCLNSEAEIVQGKTQWWATAFNSTDGAANAALVMAIDPSGQFGEMERWLLSEITDIFELLLEYAPGKLAHNIN